MPSTTHTSWIERAGLSSAKLPTRWAHRRILDVDDVETPAAGQRVDVSRVNEGVVDAAGELVVVLGELPDPRRGIGHVEDHETVPPVGRSLTRDDRRRPVFRDLHVVHGAGVHPHDVHDVEVLGIGHVPYVGVAGGAVRAGHRVVAAVRSLPDPEVRGRPVLHPAVADQLDGPADAALGDPDHRRSGDLPGAGHHRIDPRQIRDEAAVLGDEPRGGAAHPHRVGHRRNAVADRDVFERRSGRIRHHHAEMRHVPRSGRAPVRGQFHPGDGGSEPPPPPSRHWQPRRSP